MKKTLAIILAIIMIVSVSLVFTGCNSNSIKQFFSGNEPSSIADKGEIVGGWAKADSPEITDEFLKVFNKATETLTGVEYKPVAYIASQVVAGTNHLVLCRASLAVPAPDDEHDYYSLVYIYEDLDGNAEVTQLIDSDIECADEGTQAPGGWGETESPVLTDDIKKSIEGAFKELTGAEITPLALLESQIAFADAKNYCLLCESVATVPDAKAEYVITYVTAYNDGTAEITEIKNFDNTDDEGNVGISNPVAGHETLEDAEKAIGFEIEYNGIDKVINYSTIGNDILEISFKGGYLRKAKGSDDISGDNNEYKVEKSVEIDGKKVTLKGTDKLINLAVWTDGDFSYCLGFDEGTTEKEITNLVSGIK